MAKNAHKEPNYTVARFLLGKLRNSDIAKLAGYSRQAIDQLCKRQKIEPGTARVVEVVEYDSTDYPDLGELSDEEFAKEHGCSVNHARTLRRAAGLPTPKEREREEKEKKILKYAGRMSDYEAAKKADTSPVQVLRIRNKHNIKAFDPNKKLANESGNCPRVGVSG